MKKTGEFIVHIIFFLLGLIMVGCVLLISGYLVISGIPAISSRKTSFPCSKSACLESRLNPTGY